MPDGDQGDQRRYRSLDGLRGVAALVVAVHHCMLVIPGFANVYVGYVAPSGSATWWLSFSPARIVWSGDIAVWVFFVLSGFVLTVQHRPGRSWAAYYASRLPRLYLPVWGSLLVALVLRHITAWHLDPSATWWLNGNAAPLTLQTLLHDAILVRGTSTLNQPLWSLGWEVIFSVLLPLYLVLLGRRMWWPVKIAALLAVVVVAGQDHQAAAYLPLFGLGVVFAAHRDSIAQLAASRLPASPRGDCGWVVVVLASVVAVDLWWVAIGQHWHLALPLLTVIPILGVCGIFLVALLWRAATIVLGSRPAQWLGRRSYSLYLVHYPVVVSVAMLMGPRWQHEVMLVALPIALIVSDVFFRVVEWPSHRFSRWLRRCVDERKVTNGAPRRLLIRTPDEPPLGDPGPRT